MRTLTMYQCECCGKTFKYSDEDEAVRELIKFEETYGLIYEKYKK